MRSVARTAHLVVAWLLVAGLIVQVFLAGLGVFRDPASFETHKDFGYTLELLPLVDDSRAPSALVRALQTDTPRARAAAAQGLALLPGTKTVTALI